MSTVPMPQSSQTVSSPASGIDALEIPGSGLMLLAALSLVAAACWLRVWWLRRGGVINALPGKATEPAIRLKAQLKLDVMTTLYTVEWADGRQVLISASRGQAPRTLDVVAAQAAEGREHESVVQS